MRSWSAGGLLVISQPDLGRQTLSVSAPWGAKLGFTLQGDAAQPKHFSPNMHNRCGQFICQAVLGQLALFRNPSMSLASLSGALE